MYNVNVVSFKSGKLLLLKCIMKGRTVLGIQEVATFLHVSDWISGEL